MGTPAAARRARADGSAGDRPRPTPPGALTDLEFGLFERAILSRMVDGLAMTWRDLTGAELRATRLETSPMGLQSTGSTATLSVAFDVSIGARAHALTLLLPWAAVGDLLAAQKQALPRPDRRSRAAMAGALAGASVELRAEVGSSVLPLDEVARAAPRRAGPGRNHRARAVKVLGRLAGQVH